MSAIVNIRDPDGTIRQKVIPNVRPVPTTLLELKAAAKVGLAQRRWEVETGGMPFGGSTLATDDRSKLLLSSAATAARADPTFTAKWKMADGTWVTLDASTFLAAYAAVFGWVSAAFAREEALGALIDSAEDETALNALDVTIAAFWPI